SSKRIGAAPGLGDGPGADLVEGQEVEGPALLLRDGALLHDSAGSETHAHPERGDHSWTEATELDDGDELHRDRVAATKATAVGVLLRSVTRFVFGDLRGEAHLAHLLQPERREELAQHVVGRR